MRHKFTRCILLLLGIIPFISLLACAGKPEPVLQWSKTFGGGKDDEGNSVQQTADGGYIVCGRTSLNTVADWNLWLIKADADGNKIWEKILGGKGEAWVNSVQQTADSGYIICGVTKSYGTGDKDIWLVKTDTNGNELWDKVFGGTKDDYGFSVQQTSDGGYILCGLTDSYGAGRSDIWLIKTDAEGNRLWDKTFGGDGSDAGYAAQQTCDSGFIVFGHGQRYGPGFGHIWLIKTDAEGNQFWNKTFGDLGMSDGNIGKQTSDSGYIICGWTDEATILIKTDTNGNKLWDKALSGSGYYQGCSVQQTVDGGYIIGGRAVYGSSLWTLTKRLLLIRVDVDGNKLWDATFQGKGAAEGNSVQQTRDGGYIICGAAYSYEAGTYDVLLLKIAPEQ